VGMRRYVQAPGLVGEFSQLTLWQRAGTLDLVYVGYGLLVVALVLASYLLGAFGWLPHDPQAINIGLINAAPFTPGHLLGTDFVGRDLQARLILGIQAYFLPGLLAITIAVGGGAVLGILAGYRGGWFDTIITYFDNLLDSFPRLVLILLVIAAFEPDITYVMVVVGITGMPVTANLIAGKIAFLQQKNFIEAAHALGLPAHTVVLKHILWLNCRALLVIQATLGMAEAILVETSLSYLGFGVQEPTPSWGNMVQAGANYFLQGDFWPSTAPALAILATILGFQLLGDGLNNLLEGKRRN
jgi:peptide/nickel transport system permease protein